MALRRPSIQDLILLKPHLGRRPAPDVQDVDPRSALGPRRIPGVRIPVLPHTLCSNPELAVLRKGHARLL